MVDLSILIPSRNEIFLRRTIEDILAHAEGDTEIIAVLDGQWAEPQIEDHPRLTLVYHSESIGQRAATNEAARISTAPYLMKVDAHCAFDQGFDVKLLADMQPDWTMAPLMRNLHAFDWVCPNGHRRYQGPSGPCKECGGPTTMDVVWIAKRSPQSTSYRFDKGLHFQYWPEYKKHQNGDLVESMSLQGSAFLVTRDKYFELGLCDENHGSWGQQGTEVACKTWLSGGRVIVSKKTWYAHMFRTQGGDFGFPYPISGKDVDHARRYSRQLFIENKWDKAIHPLSWLIEKFAPVPEWSMEDLRGPTKAIVYYTCNTHPEDIEQACRRQLLKAGLPIISVSLNKEIDFGDTRIVVQGERSPEMMHRQILAGLHACTDDIVIVFLCESDVLYHPSHFDYTPRREDVFYFNTNVWKVRYPDGHAVWTDDLQQVSGICAYRDLLIDYYTKKLAQIEEKGFDRHYEPGTKNQTIYPRVRGGKYGSENHLSNVPIICLRHNGTLTKSKWSVDEYRDKQYAKGWKEADEVPGWGNTVLLIEAIKNWTVVHTTEIS